MVDHKSLLKLLNETNIDYSLYNHPPLFTVNDSMKFRGDIGGAHTKNLFLKDKKKKFYLFSCLESTKIDLKLLRKRMNLNNLSFASETYLRELLNVKPGAVSPFGLLNDTEKKNKFLFRFKIRQL